MALTYKEATLVRSTIPFLREHGDEVSTIVYHNLLTKYPELNNTFNLIHQKDGKLARALTVVILRYASNIHNISELIPKLERVCNKHCTLGIRPEHYEKLGRLIIDAFGEVVQARATSASAPTWTVELKAAWTKAYTVLSNMLIGRERHIYQDFERKKWNEWRKFRIDKKVAETDDVYSFYLAPATDNQSRLPTFLPGQYITVRMFVPEIGYYQTRQYSLSDAPRAETYRITVKRDKGMLFSNAVSATYQNPGLISNLLIDRMRIGGEVEISHPSGDFFLTDSPTSVPVVLISAGVGVAPLISMFNAVTETQPTRAVSWIHTCRDEAAFDKHVMYTRRRCPNVRRATFKTAIGRGDTPGITYDFEGRSNLSKVSPEVLHTDHGAAEYYICGPEDFMKSMIEQLTVLGVSSARIKCEMFSVGEMKLESVVTGRRY
jgi:nitric oxide dioxygenase